MNRFALLTLCLLAKAYGGIATFSSLAAWQSASSGVTTLDFENIAPPGSFVAETPSLTLDGVKFSVSGDNVNLLVTSSTFSSGVYSLGSGDTLDFECELTNQTMTVLLPAGVTALGFDFASIASNPPGGLAIEFSTGETFNLPFTRAAQFFGVTSTSPISSLKITPPTSQALYDNFRFGQAEFVATPEPAALYLVGFVLLVIGVKISAALGGSATVREAEARSSHRAAEAQRAAEASR